MKSSSILLAVSLCASSTFAEQPTLESLALRIKALEQQVDALKANIDIDKKETDGDTDLDKAKRSEIVINLFKDGKIHVEGQELRDEELVARIAAISKKFPNQKVRIRAGGEVKYNDVVRVLDLCQRAGAWNLSFGAQEPKDEQPVDSNSH